MLPANHRKLFLSRTIYNFMTKSGIVEGTKVKQKILKKMKKIPKSHRLIIFALLSFVVLGLIVSPLALADEFDARMNELRRENQQYQKEHNGLQVEAATFNDKINGLKKQISLL